MSAAALSILAAAREAPDAAAIVLESGEILTFAEVARRASQVMRWISERVTDDARPVAVVASLRVDVVVAFHALFELGRPVVPLHPRWTPRERQSVVEMLDVALVLDDEWRLDTCTDAGDATTHGSAVDPETALALLLTSGTSGTPKGVFLSRRAFVASAAASAANLGWTRDDRWLLSMPLAHVGGLSVVVRCLVARRSVVLVPWTGDAQALANAIERSHVTIISFVPTLLRKVLDARTDPVFPRSVRAVLVGGDAAPASLLDECHRRGVPALTTYGMTETCAQVATQKPGEAASADAGVGCPLPGIDVRIDGGEIQVRGPTMMSGYVPRDRWPTPFTEDDWFPTGDLGEIDAQGRLHVRGRRSAMIITGGENVDPLEVETVLLSCPGVRDACVFGVADERWGQTVAAAVVPVDGDRFEREALEQTIREKLAKFKRPRAIAIVGSLVTNATGKVDRAATSKAVTSALVPTK